MTAIAECEEERYMVIRWISIRKAKSYVKDHHRHFPELAGCIVALGAWKNGQLVGVGCLGRPKARMTEEREPETVEIVRVATDGTRNASSALYGKLHRLAQCLGFTKTESKTLPEESGASLRAAGFTCVGKTAGGYWDREFRRRKRDRYAGAKLKWEKRA